jgi:hypothetical protein
MPVSVYNMANKTGKTLRNLIYALPFALASFLPWNRVEGQQYTANPFVSTNINGKEYDLLKTRTQRDSLVQEKLNEDWVSEIAPSNNPLWDCTEYSSQLIKNFHGFPGLEGYSGSDLDSIYYYHGTLKDNGKYGLPVYFVLIPNGAGHNMNCILTGNDATKFEDWNFIEPQFDQINVKPGEAYIPKDCEIDIKYAYVNESQSQGKFLASVPILEFKINNGIPTLTWKNSDTNLKIITNRDSINSDLEKKISNNLKFYPNPVKNTGMFEFENNENKEVYLEIYDVSGRLIGKKSNSSKKIEFDFSDYSPGIYLYRLKISENRINVGKLIKD